MLTGNTLDRYIVGVFYGQLIRAENEILHHQKKWDDWKKPNCVKKRQFKQDFIVLKVSVEMFIFIMPCHSKMINGVIEIFVFIFYKNRQFITITFYSGNLILKFIVHHYTLLGQKDRIRKFIVYFSTSNDFSDLVFFESAFQYLLVAWTFWASFGLQGEQL